MPDTALITFDDAYALVKSAGVAPNNSARFVRRHIDAGGLSVVQGAVPYLRLGDVRSLINSLPSPSKAD